MTNPSVNPLCLDCLCLNWTKEEWDAWLKEEAGAYCMDNAEDRANLAFLLSHKLTKDYYKLLDRQCVHGN